MAALAEHSDVDLQEQRDEFKKELFNLRFQLATGQLENTARLTTVRKEVARINTELRSREIAAAEALAAEGDS